MSTLEQLRPFVNICQACGVFPYTMDYDPVTQKFRGFTFSLKNFTTWWFVFLVVSQTILPFFMGRYVKDMTVVLLSDHTLPFTINLMTVVLPLSTLIQFCASRWIFFFRFNQLRKLVKIMLQIERLLLPRMFYFDESKNSFSKRFILRFVMLITGVSC